MQVYTAGSSRQLVYYVIDSNAYHGVSKNKKDEWDSSRADASLSIVTTSDGHLRFPGTYLTICELTLSALGAYMLIYTFSIC
jgi:hypothetical protein